MRRWLTIAAGAVVALAGCGGESHQDLRAWMASQGANVKGKLEPLPQMKPYEPFAYNAFDLPDPFKPRKLSSAPCAQPPCGGPAPDLNRRKEPLEAFPLEQLKMVGTLSQGKDTYALVRADKTLYRVKKGNYMGQNFGLITDVNDSEIKLKEIVQDSAGDWAERQSVLPLLEEAGKGDRK
jgi:type IV pilus assembly protein PilP